MKRYVLSGGTGTIGLPLAKVLTDDPEAELIALVRDPERARRLPIGALPRTRLIPCDLEDAASVEMARDRLAGIGRGVAIHAAADVSWNKSTDELMSVNVDGALAMADLSEACHPGNPFIYISSAYADHRANHHRNGYEETKVMAEQALRQRLPESALGTFACSLVVGDSNSGAIERFSGIYPFLSLLAVHNPPAIVGDPKTRLDLITIDWVVAELAELARRAEGGWSAGPRDVVASLGPDRSPTVAEMLAASEPVVAAFHADLGLEYAYPTAIISQRRLDFLRRSLDVWDTPEQLTDDARRWGRLLKLRSDYSAYLTESVARPPVGITVPAPNPHHYIGTVVEWWLKTEATRLERAIRRVHRRRTQQEEPRDRG